eukprot:11931367-Prorocentrum_lima.AAC.1
MTSSLVGSEMCIRDRCCRGYEGSGCWHDRSDAGTSGAPIDSVGATRAPCLLYTSDAADDM